MPDFIHVQDSLSQDKFTDNSATELFPAVLAPLRGKNNPRHIADNA